MRAATAEAAYWSKPHLFGPDIEVGDSGCVPINEYINRSLTGDPNIAWYATIPRYGNFSRGCALGLGGRQHEAYVLEQLPALHLTIYDISEEALADRAREHNAQFPGRVSTVTSDLNFAELPPESYDLMLSDSCLHHIINLEHVAFQIDRALTPSGYFFLGDYVGESRFDFSPEKRAFFEQGLQRLRRRHPVLRYWRPVWCEERAGEFSPFEAIRSHEILPVLRRYLSECSIATAAAFMFLTPSLRPFDTPVPDPSSDPWLRLRRFFQRRLHRYPKGPGDFRALVRIIARDLVALDQEASALGYLLPNHAFAVYQKRKANEP